MSLESLKKLDKFPLRKYLKLRYGMTEIPYNGGLYYKEIVELLDVVDRFYNSEDEDARADLERLINR